MPWTFVLLVISLVLTRIGVADEAVPGKIVEIRCKADSSQRYSCYLPRAYDPGRTWPILYCFAPGGEGELFVELFRKSCRQTGWIVVGSLNSRNGPWEPIQKAMKAIQKDTEERFRLSPCWRFSTGFSGGSRVAFAFAKLNENRFSGVIAMGAGLPGPDTRLDKGLAVYLLCGKEDNNRAEMERLYQQLEAAGNAVEYKTYSGGHKLPPSNYIHKAVIWLRDRAYDHAKQEIQKAIVSADDLVIENKLPDAYVLLEDRVARYPRLKDIVVRKAKKRMAVLEKESVLKLEFQARAAFDAVQKWENDHEGLDDPALIQQCIEKYHAVIDAYPNMPTAIRAQQNINILSKRLE